MRNKFDWGNCARCGIIIGDNNFGGLITEDEIIVCDNCKRKHKRYVIAELDKFRNSKEFNERIPLRNKILWASGSLGNIFDAGDKSYIESVSDYDEDSLSELQVTLLDILQTTLENYIFPEGLEEDFEKAIKRNPDMEKLRLEVRKQQGELAEFIIQNERKDELK